MWKSLGFARDGIYRRQMPKKVALGAEKLLTRGGNGSTLEM